MKLLLEDTACRCFDLARTDLAHLSPNQATHLKSPERRIRGNCHGTSVHASSTRNRRANAVISELGTEGQLQEHQREITLCNFEHVRYGWVVHVDCGPSSFIDVFKATAGLTSDDNCPRGWDRRNSSCIPRNITNEYNR